MNIVHAVRDLELTSGGPSRSIPQLISAIYEASADAGWVQHVVFRDRGKENASLVSSPRVIAHPVKVENGKLLAAIGDAVKQATVSESASLLHVHGLWNLDVHQAIVYARAARIPYVISPRGMLSDWCVNHKRLKKRIGWWLYQRRDLQCAAAIHATSNEEMSDIKKRKLTPPVFVVANGTYLNLHSQGSPLVRPQVLCITRLHPVKGLDVLIDAWTQLATKEWTLVIAGPSENGMREQLIEQIDRSPVGHTIRLLGEVNEEQKARLSAESSIFVLPSRSENFGMSIAEALAYGLPTITTTGTPWSDIEVHNCGWYIAPNIEGMLNALREAIRCTPAQLNEMGNRAKKLIASKYSWSAIAKQMIRSYEDLCS